MEKTVDPTEALTLRIWETPLGYWAYGVYKGDGSVPGSLKAAAGAMTTPDEAVAEGQKDLARQLMIRACDHDWQPWSARLDGPRQCSKCRITDWTE